MLPHFVDKTLTFQIAHLELRVFIKKFLTFHWAWRVDYIIHKNLSLVPTLRQMNPAHILPS